MLALHGGVIADHDIAVVETLAAVDREPIPHRAIPTRIGHEWRHAAGALGDELAFWPGQADGEIVVLVDLGTESGTLDVGIDLVGDRDQAMADHFERDRVHSGGGRGRQSCLQFP